MKPFEHDVLNLKHWKTKHQFLDENLQFNFGQINWLIRNRKYNGFSKAFKKIGRSIYIHEVEFAECIFNLDDS
jgi:hypothetical protein